MWNSGLTANATLAFVLAAMVNDFSHELAHAVAALASGVTPTVTPFSVDFDEAALSATQEVVIALAGPVFSLVMGLVVMIVARNWGSGLVRLFWMWLPFMGVMNFVGYCFIAPFAGAGDTGQALSLLHAPGWAYAVVSLVGVGGQFLLARRFAVEVKRYAADLQEERQLAYFSWLIGTPIVIATTFIHATLLGAPIAQAVLVVFYGFAVGVFAPMQFIFRERVHNTYEKLALRPLNRTGLTLTIVAAAALIVLAARGGITLG